MACPLESTGQAQESYLYLRRKWWQATSGQSGVQFQEGCSAVDVAPGIVLRNTMRQSWTCGLISIAPAAQPGTGSMERSVRDPRIT